MLNNFQCKAINLSNKAYDEADSIVVFLSKECVSNIKKLFLPAVVEKAVNIYLKEHDDIYNVAETAVLTLPLENLLLTVIIAGCGETAECKSNDFRKAAGTVSRLLHSIKAKKTVLTAPALINPEQNIVFKAICEGLYLGGYTFNKFKSNVKEIPLCEVKFLSNVEGAEKVIADAEIEAEAVCFARDLVNNPGNIVTPEVMAETALNMSKEFPLEVTVMDEQILEDRGMNAILAVGKGSENPPRMIALKYNGAGDAPYTAFVGKGVTFDSGGISIKPDDNMGEMKDDMTGAAVVLGAIRAVAALRLKCNIIAVLACAENMPDGRAQRPGDIVRAANGKTIEVVSTDAEGRMVLADGVWYACRLGASKIIDIATLTGAVIIALGNETSAIVANDDTLAAQIIKVGNIAGETFWQLPALPECKEAIKSEVADLLNSAGRPGGCITGGLFIGEFVDKGLPWAHLDIGGTSTTEKTTGFKVKGGTAFGTMTLIKLAGELQ